MKTMRQLCYEDRASKYDKTLWLNDVAFTTEVFLTLLDTNPGRCAATCSLDFTKPPTYYDPYALRDGSGVQLVTEKWPYSRSPLY